MLIWRRIWLLTPIHSNGTNPAPAMSDDKLLPFAFPAVCRKQVAAAFDGGRLTSDGGVMLLSMAERRLGIADRLARCFPDGGEFRQALTR